MKKLFATLTAFVLMCSVFSLAACGENDDNGNDTTHTHNYVWVDNGDGTHKQHCNNSGCDAPDKSAGNHDYGASGVCVCGKQKPEENTHSHNYKWVDNNDGTHKQVCQNDGCDEPEINTGSHDYGTSGVCACGKAKPVENIPVTGVTLSETSLTLDIGGTAELTASIAPENATVKTVTWESDKPDIASVDSTGKVTAKAAGTAKITATTANNKTADCTVTVTAPLTNAQVLKFLNDNVLLKAAQGIGWRTAENVINPIWYITKSGENLVSANLLFNYKMGNMYQIIFCKVEFTTPLIPQNIINNEIGTPTYSSIYDNGYDTTIQTEHTALTNAICDTLFGTTESTVNNRYIIENGKTSTDSQFAKAVSFTVIEISNTKIKEQTIIIADGDTETAILQNFNASQYRLFETEKSHAITGEKLLNNNEKF